MATSTIKSNKFEYVRDVAIPSTQQSNFEANSTLGEPKLYVNENERKARVAGWLNTKQALTANQGLGCLGGLNACAPSVNFAGTALIRAGGTISAVSAVVINSTGVIAFYTLSGVSNGANIFVDIEWIY